MNSDHQPAASGNTSRVEAFSDGIFAVAITLLAIDLKAPVFARVSDYNLLHALGARWPEYLAVLNSFASVLLIWITHHEVFKKVGRVDVSLMLANGLLLLLVVCVPYPTSIMARYMLTDAGHAAAVFGALYFGLVNAAFRLLWWVISHNGRLLKPAVPVATVAAYSRAMSVGMVLYLLIVGVAFVSPFGAVLLCNAMWVYWSTASVRMLWHG